MKTAGTTTERPFYCDSCGRRFPFSSLMTSCPACGYRLVQVMSWRATLCWMLLPFLLLGLFRLWWSFALPLR